MSSIVILTLETMAYTILDPGILLIIIALGIYFAEKNRKTLLMQKMILGKEQNSLLELTLSQIVIGILLGTLGSMLLTMLGAVFTPDLSLVFILIMSLILYFIKPRFACVAYSGGIAGLIVIFSDIFSKLYPGSFGALPIKIDIPSLIAAIAVFHFIEGLAVMLDGSRGAIPVFTKMDGKIAGGFSFNRNWMITFALLFFLPKVAAGDLGSTVPTPDYWPILNTLISKAVIAKAVMTLIPLIGIMGYSSVTFTMNKREKTISSGLLLIGYSAVLFLLSQIAFINVYIRILAVIMAPLGHELIYQYDRLRELKKTPKYISVDGEYKVLDVSKGSPGEEMGLKTGDAILEINDKKVMGDNDLLDAQNKYGNFIWMKIMKENGKIEEVSYNKMNSYKKLGIIFVPKLEEIDKNSIIIKVDDDKFRDVLNKFKNGNNKKQD